MAENGRRIMDQSKPTVEKEIRLRDVKERHNEAGQKKLEEIKTQALAAQQILKERKKEHERRRQLDELKLKDDFRRQQVEERKRAIHDADRDRLEFIVKRNQERDHRLEAKKRNERSNTVFAFGSSTPRMLDPHDMLASYWNTRRATSIQNIVTSAGSTLTRRQSERDLDVGNKKRATSATGLERTGENSKGTRNRHLDRYNVMTRSVGSAPVIPAGCVSGYTGRRRTDLVPTIPSKESISSSRKSLNHSPGRAYSMTRLDQLAKPRKRHDLPSLTETDPFRPLSSSSHSSVTRSMSHLAVSKTGPSPTKRELNKADSRSMQQLTDRPIGLPRTTRTTQLREQKMFTSSNCSEASSRPSSSLSQQSTNSVASSVSVRNRLTTGPRKPRPVSIAVTGISTDNKPPLPKMRKPIPKTTTASATTTDRVATKNKTKTFIDSNTKPIKNTTSDKEEKHKQSQDKTLVTSNKIHEENEIPPIESKPLKNVNGEIEPIVENVPQIEENDIEITLGSQLETSTDSKEGTLIDLDATLTAGTEEKEIKTDKIEKELPVSTEPEVDSKELDVESNEREKPLELIKPSGEDVLNESKLLETENNNINTKTIQPNWEAETVLNPQTNIENHDEMTASMAKVRITTEEEAKAALAEKRRLIREEAERQAEMERLRIEAEAKAELERQQKEEEQLRQLIEIQRQAEQARLQEAIREAQKREEEEKLKKEEENRQRLIKEEADKKAKEDAEKQKAELQERLKNEEKEREARRKRVEAIMKRTRGKSNPNTQSTDEKNENNPEDIKSDVETKINGTKIEEQENGTTNISKDIVDNLIPSELVKNVNTVTIESMNTNDSINSNNSWRDNQQYGNFVFNNNS